MVDTVVVADYNSSEKEPEMPSGPDWATLEDGVLSLYRCDDSEAAILQIARTARDALHAHSARVYLYDEEWKDLYVPAGPDTEPLRFPVGEGAAGVAAEGRTWYVVENRENDTVYQQAVDLDENWVLAVPALDASETMVGVLEVGFAREQGQEVVEAALSLARHLGNAYLVAKGREENKRFSRGLAISYGTAVDSLQIAHSDHSQRVARLAVALAKEKGLPAERVDMLELAAFLHDVGKAFLAGAKTPDDEPPPAYLHVILAEAFLGMLEPPERFADLTRVVDEHHEYWNGSGYPKGLTGKETLLESRVLCLSNDFDGLIHGWLVPGRKMETDEAVAFLRQERGKRYEADLVDRFVSSETYRLRLRAHERYRYTTPVEVENLSRPDIDRFEGQAADISEGGLLIEADRQQEVGDLLRLFIYLPSGEPLEAIVRVVRAGTRDDGRWDIGVNYIWHASQG